MTRQRLLLLLGQSPFDPTSGAAQSMRQIAELLANKGYSVKALATTACEGCLTETHTSQLSACWPVKKIPVTQHENCFTLNIEAAGIQHQLIEVEPQRKHFWEKDIGEIYHQLLLALIDDFKPTLVLTFGRDPQDVARRELLQESGARIIFALHNLSYLQNRPAACDAFLAPSQFLASRYQQHWGIDISVLPPAFSASAILAEEREPVFVTWFNPEPAKGLWLMARLAERLGKERPDIPLLVVEGRANAASLLVAGQAGGCDLSTYSNIMFSPAVTNVADIWAVSRLVLMPSVVEEAAGRVAMEAMINGVVPIVSERGALPEMVADGGIVHPLPGSYDSSSKSALPVEVASPWFESIVKLVDDEAEYERLSAAARKASTRWSAEILGVQYINFFDSLINRE